MYQISTDSRTSGSSSRSSNHHRPCIALCWPGLLIQHGMRSLASCGTPGDGWSEEFERQSEPGGFTWLYSGCVWLCGLLCIALLIG